MRLFQPSDEPPSDIAGWIAIGLLFLPIIFVWELLSPRYSRGVRIGAAVYAGLTFLALGWRLTELYL
jgi:hypothetical protein